MSVSNVTDTVSHYRPIVAFIDCTAGDVKQDSKSIAIRKQTVIFKSEETFDWFN